MWSGNKKGKPTESCAHPWSSRGLPRPCRPTSGPSLTALPREGVGSMYKAVDMLGSSHTAIAVFTDATDPMKPSRTC